MLSELSMPDWVVQSQKHLFLISSTALHGRDHQEVSAWSEYIGGSVGILGSKTKHFKALVIIFCLYEGLEYRIKKTHFAVYTLLY